MMYITNYDSPIGRLLLAEKDGALAGLWMEGQKYFPVSWREDVTVKADSPVFKNTIEWLERYFHGEKPSVSELKPAPAGSEFRREVWKLLCEIPYGKVTTYRAIAQKVAAARGLDSMSAQAVGGAVSHNPISIIIPCHRVVGTDGSLTGYAGGLERKVRLLIHEGVDLKQMNFVL
ncbi:MAG TPA: cysteine methyltransferase [Lachnospiraceae bacterium]|nr:cysteine methyltransferase [Lachnospiraceae bacterium]